MRIATVPAEPTPPTITPVEVCVSVRTTEVTSPQWVRPAVEYATVIVLFLLAIPIIATAAMLVRITSPGRAIYTQSRLGRGGREYTIYKLRTMYHNCEEASGVRWATPGDPRITPVGRILRATHIDELPQLWNILRGEMRLIGPRPERPEIVNVLATRIPGYLHRLTIPPGVTGLAQVLLPADTELESVRRKLTLDRVYIQNQGWWMDLRILVGTGFHVLKVPTWLISRCLALPIPQAQAEPTPSHEHDRFADREGSNG